MKGQFGDIGFYLGAVSSINNNFVILCQLVPHKNFYGPLFYNRTHLAVSYLVDKYFLTNLTKYFLFYQVDAGGRLLLLKNVSITFF